MQFLRNFFFASLAPLLVVAACAFRLWQETGALPPALLTAPFERLANGGLVEAARSGETAARLSLVFVLGLALLAASLLAFAIAWLVAVVTGKNRIAMAVVFPVFSPLTLLATTAFVVGDVLLLLGLVWAHMSGVAPLVSAPGGWLWAAVLAGIGVMTVVGLIGALIGMFNIRPMPILGLKAHEPDHAKLLGFVEEVARRVDARPPKHVVVAMDLNFFATNAPVFLIAGQDRLKGETLCISLPCLHLLSEGELRAVIGHELGHFSGKDTQYSMAFGPALHGLVEATNAARRPLWKLPNLLGMAAAERLTYLAFLFHRNAAALSRDREFAADQKGAIASTPHDLAAALIKMFVFSVVWAHQGRINAARLLRGRTIRNIALTFADRVKYDIQSLQVSDLVKDALVSDIAHPHDHHPRNSERIRALQVPQTSVATVDALQQRLYPQVPASHILDDMRIMEEQLSIHLQRLWSMMGVRPPDDRFREENKIHVWLAQMLAHMVLADHDKDDREIEVAEAHAVRLVEDFDVDGFREFCRDEHALLPLEPLLEFANRLLTDDGKRELLAQLVLVAKADGKVVPEENEVFAKVKKALLG